VHLDISDVAFDLKLLLLSLAYLPVEITIAFRAFPIDLRVVGVRWFVQAFTSIVVIWAFKFRYSDDPWMLWKPTVLSFLIYMLNAVSIKA
jgi:hypothetical protein